MRKHTFLEGDGEYQVYSRLPKMGDIIHILGTPHKMKWLFLEPPTQVHIEHYSTGGKDEIYRKFKCRVYSLTANAVSEMEIDTNLCYQLVTEV